MGKNDDQVIQIQNEVANQICLLIFYELCVIIFLLPTHPLPP